MAVLEDACGVCGGHNGHHAIGCPVAQREIVEHKVDQALDRAASLPERDRRAVLNGSQLTILQTADSLIEGVSLFIANHRAERGAAAPSVDSAFDEGGRCTACRAAREDHVGGRCV